MPQRIVLGARSLGAFKKKLIGILVGITEGGINKKGFKRADRDILGGYQAVRCVLQALRGSTTQLLNVNHELFQMPYPSAASLLLSSVTRLPAARQPPDGLASHPHIPHVEVPPRTLAGSLTAGCWRRPSRRYAVLTMRALARWLEAIRTSAPATLTSAAATSSEATTYCCCCPWPWPACEGLRLASQCSQLPVSPPLPLFSPSQRPLPPLR